MGFGSYDESEQQDHDVDADDDESVSVEDASHDGEVTFETDSSPDELVDRLDEMREE